MAIEEKNGAQSSGQKSTARASSGQPQQQQQFTQQGQQAPQGAEASSRNWTFHTGSLMSAPIGRGLGSDYLTKLVAALNEVYKQANTGVEITLLTLDNVNEPALAFSSVVVCLRKQERKDQVAYHTLVIEATGEKINPIFEQLNGQQIEIARLTSDAADNVLASKVFEKVSQAFPGATLFPVDSCVVPRSFNVEDKFRVHQLALSAGLAAGTELTVADPEFKDINLNYVQHDTSLSINVNFSTQQVEDAVGEPVRSDVVFAFTSQKNTNQRTSSINSGDRENRISEGSGFLDVLWAPISQGPIFNQWAPQQMQATQKYAARLVLTSLQSNFSYTPAAVLMNIVTALALREESNWVQSFRPQLSAPDQLDLRDVGALAIEANLQNDPSGYGTRVDTKSDTFGLPDLGSYIAALFQPGLIIAVDVPDCGPQTWYLSILKAAANGSNEALRRIIRAANDLTNNTFERYFPEGTPMFTDVGNRVHMGHWTDRNGNRRDIRDIDLLAVANLSGDRNPRMISDWSDTWTQVQYPREQRLAARKKMITGLTNETAEFTGFAERVTFTAAFIDALSISIRESNLPVRINTPLSAADFNNQRGVASFVGQALVQPGQTFLGGNGYGMGNNQNMPQFGAVNRWR